MLGPIVSLAMIGMIVLVGALAIAWRLSRWGKERFHGVFYSYLIIAALVGFFFANVPNMVLTQGFAWWSDYCQPNIFYGLIVWFVFSVASMYFAPKSHLITPFFSVIATIICFVVFLFMAEAGDIQALTLQFWIMKCAGALLGAFALGTLVVIFKRKWIGQQKLS